ncbi:hypothetical protein SteCoe_25459 [Stentor coeruleus]|uniref:J domain-containing protein n=1 Tax=Stentor coeruleus TaxID=5963 RepID=A0A1R2BF65_9CILI|nr:hypothetical protein SteCoe_25459 [Stentor coeruleus]
MSGFKETFTKEEGGEKNLDYDDSAFFYFAAVLEIVILLPLIFSFIKNKILGYEKKEKLSLKNLDINTHHCPCSICAGKRAFHITPESASQKFGFGGIFQLLLISFLCYLLYITILSISESPQGIKRFDPYEILGIEIGATDKQIRSAFREMSKIYHPDKNIGNNWAAGKYLQITRAYETLTNELAKSNYERYGNPDGPSSIRFAIGLPRFLLKTENHISILIVFFIIILIVIPGSVLFWINTSKRFDKNGVLQENAGLYARVLNENLQIKHCLFMVAISLEFQDINAPKSESGELAKLRNRYLEHIPKRQNINPRILKVMLLLLAHMDRREVSETLKKDTIMIISKAVNMIETMLDASYMLNLMQKTKKMSIRTFTLLIEFSQLLTQGLMLHDSNVLMLPKIDESLLKFLGNKKKPKISELKDNDDFKKIQEKLSPEAFEDFKVVLNYLPELKVTAEAYVDGEEGISEGDLVSVKFTIERLTLKEGQKQGIAHSSFFPLLRLEKLWIILADPIANKVYYLKSIQSCDKIIEDKDFKFPIGPNAINIGVGKHKWEVHVKSDCYYGLDVVIPLEFEVLPTSQIKKDIFVHPDDQKIEKQTTWIQQVMSGLQAEESSEEEMPELEEGLESKELEDIIDS